jgi:hypothetical protein
MGKVSFESPASTDEPIESGAGLGPGEGDVKRVLCAHYGPLDEFAEYVFRFVRTPEGKLLKFGAVAPLARQVIDIFGTNN